MPVQNVPASLLCFFAAAGIPIGIAASGPGRSRKITSVTIKTTVRIAERSIAVIIVAATAITTPAAYHGSAVIIASAAVSSSAEYRRITAATGK